MKPETPVHIREFALSDYDAIIALWQKAGLPFKSRGRDHISKIAKEIQKPTALFLVAEAEGQIVGSIFGTHAGRKGWINRLAVRPDFQKQGIAGQLLAEAEKKLLTIGLEIISCLIEDGNQSSVRFFTRHGYSHRYDVLYFSKKKTPRDLRIPMSPRPTTMKLKKGRISDILKISEEINQIKDLDSLLDRILAEARKLTMADAGSIYLVEADRLKFSYVQNDSLMRGNSANQYLYMHHEVTIDRHSIAGYVALTQRPLMIADVYKLNARVPYRFNRSFDETSSYRTVSVLTVPLQTSTQKTIGVIQIINRLHPRKGILPFSREDRQTVGYFASHAASAIERARMTREMVLRMVKMAELRDPQETANHVNRVGSYAIEIYQRWALNQGLELETIKKFKDILRIAAMLHDVGKVAITDAILRKKAKLQKIEYFQMKWHTVYGARLFKDSTSDWDDMAAEIALNHHERWDGRGYPGVIRDIDNQRLRFGKGKKGRGIPLTARIVALADVYDALKSARIYKEPWSELRVLRYLKTQRGKHFDPQIVDAFFQIYDVIRAINLKYSQPRLEDFEKQ